MNFEIHAYISPLFPLSLPGHSLGYHGAFSCHVSLAFCHLIVSQFLSFVNLTFVKLVLSYFHEYRYFFMITMRL